jgi:2-methylcitrate dehydratase PrpD
VTPAGRTLAEFIASRTIDNIPTAALELARRGILDAIGCAFYGRTLDDMKHLDRAIPRNAGDAVVWGSDVRADPIGAALQNATAVHVTELSETAIRAAVHPGNVVIPAAVAAAELIGSSGADLLVAVACGYEALIRFGYAAGVTMLTEQRLHTFSITGTLGAAAAAAAILGKGDPDVIDAAIAIAACLAPTTLLQAATEGSSIKHLFEGVAASRGHEAAILASRGVTGPTDWATEWLHALARPANAAAIAHGLGAHWLMTDEILRIKQYPVMGLVQPTSEATRSLLETWPDLSINEITSIRVDSTRRAFIARDQHPTNLLAARTSIPFTVAALLTHREEGLADRYLLDFFQPALLADAETHALAELCTVEEDPEFENNFEHADEMKYESRVTVRLTNGSELTSYADVWKSTVSLTFDQVVPKFLACSTRLFDDARAQEQVAMLAGLEQLDDARLLTAKLAL